MFALLLYAHGARDPAWAEPVRAIAQRVASLRPGVFVGTAYLEHMAPDLMAAVAESKAAGATDIAVVPLFLGRGGHLQRDLPLMVNSVRAAHPGVSVRVLPSLGEITEVLDAIAGWIARQGEPSP